METSSNMESRPKKKFSLDNLGRRLSQRLPHKRSSSSCSVKTPSNGGSLVASPNSSPALTPAILPDIPSEPSFCQSMHVGTQSLIQALQTLHWSIQADHEEESFSQSDFSEAEDDDDKEASTPSSSIPTIYRPFELGRIEEQQDKEAEIDVEATPRPPAAPVSQTISAMAARAQRHAKLAQMLKEVFELPDIEDVIAGYSPQVWVIDQEGPPNQTVDQTLVVLKNDTLSWYQSSSDIYFPHGVMELRYAVSCEPVGEKEFRVTTNQKSVLLAAESRPTREMWVRMIQKVMFQSQHTGDCVKVRSYLPSALRFLITVQIAIPYSAILDVDKSSALDFSETIEVKVLDHESHLAMDSYFFAYFRDLPGSLDQIRDAVRAHHFGHQLRNAGDMRLNGVIDTTTPQRSASLPARPNLTPPSGASTPPTPLDEPTLVHSNTLPSAGGIIPHWLKGVGKLRSRTTDVKEVYTSQNSSSSTFFTTLENPDAVADAEVLEKFRTAFAYDEKEKLLGYFPGFIARQLPVHGLLYISSHYFCFKSSGALAVRTRASFSSSRSKNELTPLFQMAIPIRDVVSTQNSQGAHFGHHGLVVIIKGYEELFFEFESAANAMLSSLSSNFRWKLCGNRMLRLPRHQSLRDQSLFSMISLCIGGSVEEGRKRETDPVDYDNPRRVVQDILQSGENHISLWPRGLLADGHRVRIATHGEYREWVESYGIEFGNVGGDPAELMRLSVDNGMFTPSFLKEGLLMFRGWLDDLLKRVGKHVKAPTSSLKVRVLWQVPDRKRGGSYNYMTYVIFDQVFWRATSGSDQPLASEDLGIGSTSLDKMEPHKIPFLYNFSPSVVPPPVDWPDWIPITGYWFLDSANPGSKKWEPPADLLEFLETASKLQKKVVYIGFGSIVVPDPRAMTRTVVDAIVQSGVYAILAKGWSDRLMKAGDAAEPEEPLPKQIYSISSIPHDWLFERIDAACHHGGAGTTGASLRAMGVNIRKENGVQTALLHIYRNLSYARAAIKNPAVIDAEMTDDEA
ncbi:putative UGT51-sterol glucosyltransferase [Mycena floridula]|nr:putative UGT51-sterol glucosyltransferase [Mycena floridula]